jgi:hypothetical protein
MLDFLLSIFLGWPAVLGSVILAAVGLVRRNYQFLVAASILAVPFSWYISGFPVVRSPLFLLPLFAFGAAFAMYRKHEMIAWIIAVPFFLGVLLLYYVVSAG